MTTRTGVSEAVSGHEVESGHAGHRLSDTGSDLHKHLSAEGKGFEPLRTRGPALTVFKTVAFGRSASPPRRSRPAAPSLPQRRPPPSRTRPDRPGLPVAPPWVQAWMQATCAPRASALHPSLHPRSSCASCGRSEGRDGAATAAESRASRARRRLRRGGGTAVGHAVEAPRWGTRRGDAVGAGMDAGMDAGGLRSGCASAASIPAPTRRVLDARRREGARRAQREAAGVVTAARGISWRVAGHLRRHGPLRTA